MRAHEIRSRAGFTLVELTVVVVISTVALLAIYQTLITQERSYRYQSAAIDAQGSTRTGIALLTTELRGISATAGAATARGGSDLLVATADSLRFRAFRKTGIACDVDTTSGHVHVWTLGTAFTSTDTVMAFLEGDTLTDEDDVWAAGLPLGGVTASSLDAACSAEWDAYDVQELHGFAPDTLGLMERGALIRSYIEVTYGAYEWDGEWVVGRRNEEGELMPLVGPIMPPDSGGLEFRYFDQNNSLLSPTTAALRARIARVEVTIRGLSRGAGLGNENHVDSLTTNVFLRGN